MLNGGTIATVAEWHDGFFANPQRQFMKGGPLWQRHRLQWLV